ncbi:MAG: M56 family metallopeptidase [Sphingomicrobium sp.]
MIAWLLGTLIVTSALMALVLVTRVPVRRLFGAGVTYALWLLPAARAVLPSFTQTVERTVPATQPVSFSSSSIATSGAASNASAGTDWLTLLLALWLAGAAVMLARGLITYRHQRRGILDGAVQLARLDGIRIMRSERIRGPLAFGIVDRVIVLPFDFDQTFTERQRCLALDHELAHHRCGDLVANLFAYVLLCLQWFNPLAWAAHSAFRFDQEAACDARVLDKAKPGERASYGAAIAKAASGRTLLFAGALDRPSTLSRRLSIMTRSPSGRARAAGFTLIGAGLLLALPLTATRAIQYVDIPAAGSNRERPVAPVAPNAPSAPLAMAQLAAGTPESTDLSVNGDDETVRIGGVTKRWEDLSPQERAEIRADLVGARRDLDQALARLPEELARVQADTARFRNGEFQREMAKAREELRRGMLEIDRNARDLKSSGVDAEELKADLARSLAEIEKMDIDKIVREALSSVDMAKIRAEIGGAGKSLDDIDARLNELDRQ